MDNIKDDAHYVSQVIENISCILAYANGKTKKDIMEDAVLNDAIMFRLVQLGENTQRLSHEFKASHANVPWGLIAGFRNGIVHDYAKTDQAVIYEIITKDLKDLKASLVQKENQK